MMMMMMMGKGVCVGKNKQRSLEIIIFCLLFYTSLIKLVIGERMFMVTVSPQKIMLLHRLW